MRALRSKRNLTAKEVSDRIAREEAYASEIPGLTYIKTAENNTKDQCDFTEDGSEFNTSDHFRSRLSRTAQNLPHILEDNSSATSIVDGQNLHEHGFGDSTDESATEVDESEYELESESDGELLSNNTRTRKNCREKNVHGSTQLNEKQHLISNVGLQHAVDGKKRYKCKQCEYGTNHKNNFTTHVRTHTAERPFKCKKCSYAANQRDSLIRHERIHSGARPYKCGFCKYAAAESSTLVTHIRTHTGEKPHKCRLCKYAAAARASLDQHMRTHHTRALKLYAGNSKKTGKKQARKIEN